MTKIYLVKATYYIDGKFYDVVSEVFTNRNLAETYCEFRNELPSPKWLNEEDFRNYEVKEMDICKLDYTNLLQNLRNG